MRQRGKKDEKEWDILQNFFQGLFQVKDKNERLTSRLLPTLPQYVYIRQRSESPKMMQFIHQLKELKLLQVVEISVLSGSKRVAMDAIVNG